MLSKIIQFFFGLNWFISFWFIHHCQPKQFIFLGKKIFVSQNNCVVNDQF